MTTPPLDLPALREIQHSPTSSPWAEIEHADFGAVLDRVEELEAERGTWKSAAAAESTEAWRTAAEQTRLERARAEAAEKKVAAVREALEAHPKACDRHTEDDPIKCGWKRAVADVTRALDGTP